MQHNLTKCTFKTKKDM